MMAIKFMQDWLSRLELRAGLAARPDHVCIAAIVHVIVDPETHEVLQTIRQPVSACPICGRKAIEVSGDAFRSARHVRLGD